MPRGVNGPDTFTTQTAGPGRQAPDLGVIITVTGLLTGTGAVTATFQLEGSNDGSNWFAVGAAQAMTGTAPQTAAFTRVQFAYAQYRINCTVAPTGTNALLTTHWACGS